MTVTEWSTLIPLIFAGIVLVINTVMQWRTQQDVRETKQDVRQTKQDVVKVQETTELVAADQNKKLEVIHDNGNAHLQLMTEKLAESEKRNERLILESNAQTRQAFSDAALRIERLEAQRDRTQAAPPPSLDTHLGKGDGEVQKIEIQQPHDNPVPVIETIKEELIKKETTTKTEPL